MSKCLKEEKTVKIIQPSEAEIAGKKLSKKKSSKKSSLSVITAEPIDDAKIVKSSGNSYNNNNANNIRMIPINERLRNVFDMVRQRINNNTNSSTETVSHNAKHKPTNVSKGTTTRTAVRKSSQSNHFNSNLNSNKQTESSNRNADGKEMETCQLCYSVCYSSAHEANAQNEAIKSSGAPLNYMYSLSTCEHSFCVNCLRQYLKYQIIEARVSISCPECVEKMHPSDIYKLLQLEINIPADVGTENSPTTSESLTPLSSDPLKSTSSSSSNEWPQLINKYEEFMLRRVLVSIPDTRFCPAPDCSYAVIASGCANCPQIHCMRPDCNTSFCYHCKQRWHPNITCEDAALQALAAGNFVASTTLTDPVSGNIISSHGLLRSFIGRSNSHLSSSSSVQGISSPISAAASQPTNTIFTSRNVNGDWIKEEIKRCPKCQALIVKMDDGSCNHITCSVCGCEFCWLCMKEISDLHYLSPSGCTFWGKKPWSRKKKIMWQLGTLVGAPVGIALIAGVAVPAILIGLPIWAGRKVYIRYKNIGKHKRNVIVVGTVLGTALVAPLVATLAVGIGVPILLAYVYGVVPISLCRSGGCGVTTNNNGGVRFAFDDEPTTTVDNSASYLVNQTTSSIAAVAATSAAQFQASLKDKERNNEDSSKTTTTKPSNSVTIPISAIDSAEMVGGGGGDKSSEANPTSMTSSATPTSSSSSVKYSSNMQTPLFVTITMGSKHVSNAATTYSACSTGTTQMIKGRNNQIIKYRSANNSSSSSHQTHKQSRLNNNTNIKKPLTFTKTINSSSILSSASIACGTVEMDERPQVTSVKKQDIINNSYQLIRDSKLQTANTENTAITSAPKSVASETGTALNYLYTNNYNQATKIACKSLNPSIGEESLGEDLSFEDIDYMLEEQQKTAAKRTDRRVVKIIKNHIVPNDDEKRDIKSGSCDRDTVSNRALAGDSFSTTSSKQKRDDLKSINSYEKCSNTLNPHDFDAYSVSIVSNDNVTDKSANPSVVALVGSIKDNVSVANLSTKS